MIEALERLRAGSGNGVDPLWRASVVESAAVCSRGVAALIESLRPSAESARDMTDEHLQAQRFARVRVAEIALYQASQVKAGRSARDLYATLKPQIDGARKGFQEKFLREARGIPDYLHQEIVLVLAQNNASLLGPS